MRNIGGKSGAVVLELLIRGDKVTRSLAVRWRERANARPVNWQSGCAGRLWLHRWHVAEIGTERGASMDAMGGVWIVDRVMEGEVIEHGLLALLDHLEVGIHGPVSRPRTGNGASFRTDVDSLCSRVGRHGPWHEAKSPKCRREPW